MTGNFHIGFKRACTIIIGAVFFISGLLKLNDPTGTSLIVESYFRFLHVDFLLPLSKSAGLAAGIVESVLGAALVAGLWRKVLAFVTWGVLGVFTILTLVLLVVNPEMSCGCFGEAIPLTHFQSFVKNLVLDALSFAAFIPVNDGTQPRKPKYAAFAAASLAAVALSIYASEFLPLQDFTAYSQGVELEDREFSFRDPFGEYVDSIALEDRKVVISIYSPEDFDAAEWNNAARVVELALSNGIQPMLMMPDTDSCPPEMNEFLYFSDIRTLQTLNRSNGGVTYLYDGLIVSKWASGRLPDDDTFAATVNADPYDIVFPEVSARRIVFQAGILAAFALLLLL